MNFKFINFHEKKEGNENYKMMWETYFSLISKILLNTFEYPGCCGALDQSQIQIPASGNYVIYFDANIL